jgi:uracil-DNA glycosylase
VLSGLNGRAGARIMFVAEAPGRLGAHLTRMPLSGDATGRNFEKLLQNCGLSREQVYVTNAVLCNPRDAKGRNRTPAAAEISACTQAFLMRQIIIVDPDVVITLGLTALKALKWIEPHGLSLSHVGQVFPWWGRLLSPLYHPSPRVVNTHRSLETQTTDLGRILRSLGTHAHQEQDPAS